MKYRMTFTDLPTGAVADTFTTLCALVVANTTGHRCRARAIGIGPSDDAPADVNACVSLERSTAGSAGTAGSSVTGANMAKLDPGSIDSLVTGGRAYSAEPTYETEPLFRQDFNIRGGIIKEWSELDAPICTANRTLGLRVAPRTAAAKRFSGFIEFELY